MLQGSYVAIVTPFKNKDIDYSAVERLLHHHLDNGTDGILLLGTTGEAPTLASDEKERYIRFCVQKIDGKVPVMMGTGTNNLNHTIAMTARAKSWGVDSALVITPYYNKPTQEGLYQFFKAVEAATDIPIVMYNVPGRTGVNMSAETAIRLANECEGIVALKAASGDIVKASLVVRETSDDFAVLSGEDPLNMPLMACGASGFISVTANVVPDMLHKLWALCSSGDYSFARKLHQQLLELNKVLFIETNPIPVKESLAMMGMIQPEFRLPMCPLLKANRQQLMNVLKSYKLID
ncbi:MAG: 4-hydroxy-tetrahydrodipicolinate synthase [Candidatus Cloacimonetes bacterium]|nr:4-hydroxy-tetrahydrodipicolinate synthase [Candidatus Cloacimonadota bacterium]